MSKYSHYSATFSDCRTWRYLLERSDTGWPTVNFICLNPSTADETQDDPTVRRCIGFAQRWGFNRLVLTNLFAFRATNPKELRACADPTGPDNVKYILETAKNSTMIVCAWGNHGRFRNRGYWMEGMLRNAGLTEIYHLGMTHAYRTKAEPPCPRHPLYLCADTKPVLWTGLEAMK